MNVLLLASAVATINGGAMFGDQVLLRVEGPVQGSAFLFRSGEVCAALTAYHVVERGAPLTLVSGGGLKITGSVKTQWRTGQGLDVALLRLDNAPMAACPDTPDLGVGRRMEQQPLAMIVSLDVTDKIKRIPVSIDNVQANRIDLRPLFASDNAYASLSGSPVVVDGVPVAVVVRVTDKGSVEAVPLTAVASAAPEVFSATIASFVPYDETVLPGDVRNVVLEARRNRKAAETAMKSADEAADLGVEAAKKATMSVAGYLDFPVDGGRYRGEVGIYGSQTNANGYGQRIVIGGDNNGNITEGAFNGKNEGYVYSGRLKFAENANNTGNNIIYEGQFGDKGGMEGFGILSKTDGAKFFGKWIQGNIGGSAVWEDGSVRLEVKYTSGSPDGLGAQWDSQGRLIRCGLWSKGTFSKAVPGCPGS